MGVVDGRTIDENTQDERKHHNMSSLNKVILIGNLTRDPELRTTPNGTPVGEIALAMNETFKTRDGEPQERTTYVDVVLWGRQAEVANDYLSKGRQVMVEGKLQLDQWESKEGEKRSRIRVRGENLQFLGSRQTAQQD